MIYHPTIEHLDAAAADFHARGMMAEKNSAHRLAGIYQQRLYAESPYPRSVRYLAPQWYWALGHIGLLYQLIRYFRLRYPETRLRLVAGGKCPNIHFLNELIPFLSPAAEGVTAEYLVRLK